MAILGLQHVHIRVRELEGTRSFATDFGLHEAAATADHNFYLRGAGTEAYQVVLESAQASSLAGVAFAVDGCEDLDRAVAEPGELQTR